MNCVVCGKEVPKEIEQKSIELLDRVVCSGKCARKLPAQMSVKGIPTVEV